MWRPVVILAAAGYLLFFNDQGRELGHSLLGQHDLPPIIFLFVALVYWAANTWHSAARDSPPPREWRPRRCSFASLGTSKDKPNGHLIRGDERWLYWPPRLLGVCAHLFAAISLSLAAWNVPRRSPIRFWIRRAAMGAPMAHPEYVVRHRSERAVGHRARNGFCLGGRRDVFTPREGICLGQKSRDCAKGKSGRDRGGCSRFSPVSPMSPAIRITFAGLPPGTICIVLSAMVFLGLIGWSNLTPPLGAGASARERRRTTLDSTGRSRASRWVCLFSPFSSQSSSGRFQPGRGSGLDGCRLFRIRRDPRARQCDRVGDRVCQWAPRSRSNGVESGRRLEPSARAWSRLRSSSASSMRGSIRFIGCGFATAATRPCAGQKANSRRCGEGLVCASKGRLNKRSDGPVPMLIVATAGGGIRAAYWTATVLEKLEDDFADRRAASVLTFSPSAAFRAAASARWISTRPWRDVMRASAARARKAIKKCPRATDFLKEDFLAPALASLVFQDAPSSFLPDFGQGDRGAALRRVRARKR